MKNFKILVLSFLCFLSLFNLRGCTRNDLTLEEQRKRAGIKPPAEDVRSNGLITFVELGSVNCIPCRMMQPVMKEIGKKYSGKVKVVFIDVLTEQGQPYLKQFGVESIPTQVFIDQKGKELARHTGFYPKDSIIALLTGKGIN